MNEKLVRYKFKEEIIVLIKIIKEIRIQQVFKLKEIFETYLANKVKRKSSHVHMLHLVVKIYCRKSIFLNFGD